MSDKLFSFSGIVTDAKGRSKVRFGNDLVGRIKVLTKAGATRLDFVDLPEPMGKIEAIRYLMADERFQSAEDQAICNDALETRLPKVPKRRGRKPKAGKVVAEKKTKPSIDSIKSRAKKSTATVSDVLAATQTESQSV